MVAETIGCCAAPTVRATGIPSQRFGDAGGIVVAGSARARRPQEGVGLQKRLRGGATCQAVERICERESEACIRQLWLVAGACVVFRGRAHAARGNADRTAKSSKCPHHALARNCLSPRSS